MWRWSQCFLLFYYYEKTDNTHWRLTSMTTRCKKWGARSIKLLAQPGIIPFEMFCHVCQFSHSLRLCMFNLGRWVQSLIICHRKKKVTWIYHKNIVKGVNRHFQRTWVVETAKCSPFAIEVRIKNLHRTDICNLSEEYHLCKRNFHYCIWFCTILASFLKRLYLRFLFYSGWDNH